MTLLVFRQYLLRTLVLLVHHLQHLVVHNLGSSLRIRTLELVLLIVIVAQIRQFLAHTCKGHHAVCLLGGTLQVVHGTRRDATNEQLLGSTSTQQRTHLVEHGLFGLQHTLFRQIPRCSQSTTTWYDAHLHQWVGKLREPRDGSVTSLVDGYRTFLGLRHHLRLLLQTTNDAVYSV